MVDISVVLPAFNEARAIAGSLARLVSFLEEPGRSERGWESWEIVVVDDGSADGTAQRARAAAAGDPRVRVLARDRHEGKGAAMAAGLVASAGEVVIMTDVDLSYSLDDLARAADLLRESEPGRGRPFDVVTGDRRHPESRMSLALSALGHVARRQILSWTFNVCVRAIYHLPWRDTQCGLKGLRREAIEAIVPRLRTRGFLADIEILLIARRLGLTVASIPVHLTYLSGDSTVRVLAQALRVAADAVRIRVALSSGRYDRPRSSIGK